MDGQRSLEETIERLGRALEEALEYGSDEPTARAFWLAAQLLRQVTAHAIGESVDVSVAEDGSISITAFRGHRQLILDIPPSGKKVSLVVQDSISGEIVASSPQATESDVAYWVERAA
jgi:hypothetical protein